jgi:hypothetical protein
MLVDVRGLKVGDKIKCRYLDGIATVYHVDERAAFVFSPTTKRGHDGNSSGVKTPQGLVYGHWNLWFRDETKVEKVTTFKGNK